MRDLEGAEPGRDDPRLKVLVVDDNEASAVTLGWAVEAEGYDVRTVLSGQAALDLAKDFRPDIVLLDLGMPGMSGFDVCRALRNDPDFTHIKIIAQTGWGDESARKRTAESGFDLHMVKPVNIDVLHDMLDLLARSIRLSRQTGVDFATA